MVSMGKKSNIALGQFAKNIPRKNLGQFAKNIPRKKIDDKLFYYQGARATRGDAERAAGYFRDIENRYARVIEERSPSVIWFEVWITKVRRKSA